MLISIPSFALGVILKYLFAIKFDVVPAELRRQRSTRRAAQLDGAAGADAGAPCGRRLPAAATAPI